jgi:hypothetical protein
MTGSPDDDPDPADQYRYSDGTVEIVLAVEDDRILTLKEYPDDESFEAAVGDGEFLGTNPAVASLPDVEAVRDEFDGFETDDE